jgi:hypothetical protein
MKNLISKMTKAIVLSMLLNLMVMGLNAQDFKVTPCRR